MAKRDYAVRGGKKKKNAVNKTLLLAIAGFIILAFVSGLYLLKQKAPQTAPQQVLEKSENSKPKSQLPSRPEETWSYIKELESRTIVNSSTIQLNESQKAELKRLEEAEKAKKAALDNLIQEEIQKSEVKEDAQKTLVQEVQDKKEPVIKEVKVETAKKEENKKTGKFGLQCGAFNDRGKAENLQARLAMSGLNARITESGKWKRVVVGPVGDRSAATKAQQQASSITGCVVVSM